MSRRLPFVSAGPGAVTSTDYRPLTEWTLASTPPGEIDGPAGLAAISTWHPATAPGTVAAALGPAGPGGLDGHDDYDAVDWWYRCAFEADPDGGRTVLRLDGLATLATVYLNGEEVLVSANMFVGHRVDVSDLVRRENELVIVFRSLGAALSEKRPRPAWKTKLVEQRNLRWFRTTLLGRIPGWTPRIHPVGPWRAVGVETVGAVDVTRCSVRGELRGEAGVVHVAASARLADGSGIDAVRLRMRDQVLQVPFEVTDTRVLIDTELSVGTVQPWWPKTHGEPHLYPVRLELDAPAGTVQVDAGSIGFRSVEVDERSGGPRFLVNGVPIFCRGACWTTSDIVSLAGDPARMEATLRLAADANANMIRVGGTMVYESDSFYEACDRLGLMVWQDFMFANMEYPADDPDFVASVETEVRQQLERLSPHPCVVAWCGGSEMEQQAAMFGAPRDRWVSELFRGTVSTLVEELAPGTPYWSSTPTGGDLPFHVDRGLGHYYGVGAYRRPLDDARHSEIVFSPESLGFSNVPEPSAVRTHFGTAAPATHTPRWKAGVPRDSGAGWDFEDVRDHYLEHLFGHDPVALRSADLDRYHRLSRTVTGRVMSRVFDELRSPRHPCGGALVWFLQDLRPGAGWGIIDVDGNAKPVWHFLRRAWAPLRIALLDRGVNGVRIEVHNERAEDIEGDLVVTAFTREGVSIAEGRAHLRVPARGTAVQQLEGMLDRFLDPTWTYRFGPRVTCAVVATLDVGGAPRARTVFWPTLSETLPPTTVSGMLDAGGTSGRLESTGLARSVRIDLSGGRATTSYEDLVPGDVVTFGVLSEDGPVTGGSVEAENDPTGARLRTLDPEPS